MLKRPQLWIDFETGGTDPYHHSPLSVAMIGVDAQGRILGEFYQQLRFKTMTVDHGALAVNKIDLRMPGLTEEQFREQYWLAINQWFYQGGAIQPNRTNMPVRGGHNILPFDNFILERCIGNWTGSFSYSIDTLALALALREMGLISPDNLKLGTLIQYFGVKVDGELHNALVDLRATVQLWEKLQEVVRGTALKPLQGSGLFGGADSQVGGF